MGDLIYNHHDLWSQCADSVRILSPGLPVISHIVFLNTEWLSFNILLFALQFLMCMSMLIHSSFENTAPYQEETPAYLHLIKVELSILSTGSIWNFRGLINIHRHTETHTGYIFVCLYTHIYVHFWIQGAHKTSCATFRVKGCLLLPSIHPVKSNTP